MLPCAFETNCFVMLAVVVITIHLNAQGHKINWPLVFKSVSIQLLVS